jgi:hypothetical protein
MRDAMKDGVDKYLLARVDIPATEPLKIVADRLSQLMPGFALEAEEEDFAGRFDEVPAFIAERGDIEFVLLGAPEGEPISHYELKFRCETDQSIETLLARDGVGFLRQFVSDKPVVNTALMDFSEELAQVLVRQGIEGCRPFGRK